MISRLGSMVSSGAQDLVLVVGMIGILMILFVPISKGALDFLLLLNFTLALLILLITFYTEKPLEFSTFPSLLLMTTLFRLSLNVSTTRLILQDADAGRVIEAVGSHVISGNYVIGLVIFFILIVVQYIVVTNGAQRVAEVAARFTLDSLPGKQMSIDADLNMGLIDSEEARKRRSLLERESNFYGAMDGASKFVKGDAIAGIIIILINIVGGLSIGLFQRDMTWSDALHRYTLLTVGDGIVTQIPSLIIAVASGIIITRAATDARLGVEVIRQFSSQPKTILIIVVALIAQALIPGIPFWPVMFLILVFGGIYWLLIRGKSAELTESIKDLADSNTENQFLQDVLNSPFEVKVGGELHNFFNGKDLDIERRINVLRKNTVADLGILLPTLTFKKESRVKGNEYKILIHGEPVATGTLNINRLLAINPRGDKAEIEGEDTIEPTYGLPARWIVEESRRLAMDLGFTVIEPETVFLTHLQETIKRNAGNFITRYEAERMLEARKAELGSVVDEIVPTIIAYSDIQKIFQGLLNEQVSIKNIPLIVDVIADVARVTKDPEEIVERCREKLRATICDSLTDAEGKVHVITLYPGLERKLINTFVQKDTPGAGLSPKELDQFVAKLIKETDRLLKVNVHPVILCAGPVRRHLRKLVKRALPLIKVLSINEVDDKVNLISSGTINLEPGGEQNA